jgi:hypothetical protein
MANEDDIDGVGGAWFIISIKLKKSMLGWVKSELPIETKIRGIFDNQNEAMAIIANNNPDIYEESYQYAVAEFVPFGYAPFGAMCEQIFFEWNGVNGYRKSAAAEQLISDIFKKHNVDMIISHIG